MISNINTLAWANLVLELARHDLDVGPGNEDTGVQASLVMSVSDRATEAHIGTNTAIVRSLGTWVTIVGPSEGLLRELGRLLEESVLLLDTVPCLLGFDLWIIPDIHGKMSEVCVRWHEILPGIVLPSECLAHDDDVVTSSEGIPEESDWLEDNLGHLGHGLVSAGAIVVPLGEVLDLCHLLGECAGLGSKTNARSIDPNILSDDAAMLFKIEE